MISLLLLLAPAIQQPHEMVSEGLEHFAAGRFEEAAQAFADAAAEAPGEPVPGYDAGCALLALGEADRAREQLSRAAAARDPHIAAAARYNLGLLAAGRARERLGEDPGGVAGEDRQEVQDELAAAARRFQDCLEVDPEHEDARFNLELVRLYAKQLEDLWKQRDEERQSSEPEENLLRVLTALMQAEEDLRDDSDALEDQPPDDVWLDALRQAAEEQRQLLPDADKVQELLEAELQRQPAPAGASAQDEEFAEAKDALRGLAREAASAMEAAVDRLEGGQPSAAEEEQAGAVDRLETLFETAAPFEALLRAAVEEQRVLLLQSRAREPQENGASGGQGEPAPGAEAPPVPESGRLARRQEYVSARAALLAPHAEQRLQQLDAQAAPGPGAVPPGAAPPAPGPPGAAGAPGPAEALRPALEKALENAPRAAELASQAAEVLQAPDYAAAATRQAEALALLEEIAALMPQKGDSRQDSRQQEQDAPQDQPEKQPGDPQDGQENPGRQEGADEPQPRPRQMSREQAERLLQRAREREQDYRRRLAELRRTLGAVPVEKDW